MTARLSSPYERPPTRPASFAAFAGSKSDTAMLVDGRMPGGKARAQRADAPGSDDAEPDLARPHWLCHARHLTKTGSGAGPPFGMPTRPAAITADTIT